jgi:hypothetical protein
MKKAVAVLIALMLLSSVALAEGRSFVLNRDVGAEVYAWDGTRLTQPGTYLSGYSITNDQTTPEDELFAAQSANQTIPENGDYVPPRYALVDWQGKQLTDFKYDSLDYDKTSDAVIYSINGVFGVMTRSLQELVPCKYDAVLSDGEGGFVLDPHSDEDTPEVEHMAKGGAPTPTGVKARFYWGSMVEGLVSATDESGFYGFLNGQGQWAIAPQFDYAQNFTGGYAIVKQKDKTGLIDETGKWTVRPSYDDDRGLLSDGSAALLMKGTRAYLVRPSDGKQLYSLKLTKDGYVSTGSVGPVIAVTDKGKTTLYNASGKSIVSLNDSYSFDLYSPLPGGRLLATSTTDGLLMDSAGKTLYKAQGLNYLDTVDGKVLLASGRFKTHMVQYQGDTKPTEEVIYGTYRYGLIDSDGNTLLPMVYTQLYPLIPGRYFAEDAKHWGVIDQTGNWIVSGSQYDDLTD